MRKKAFAIVAHPDDIELVMGGTFILLGKAGYELHYMTLANGCCGTATMSREEITLTRTAEARTAAESVGAIYHPPIVNDAEIFYVQEQLVKLTAVMRQVNPEIVLAPSPLDYMEDHINASRLAVTAAFCKGMRNYITDPYVAPVEGYVSVYHALPFSLRDQLKNPITPEMYVDITSVLDQKRDMLACHKSQKEWLDYSQGMDSYLISMVEMCEKVGKMSGKFKYAEGWQQHLHVGFCPEDFDPLRDALKDFTA